MRNTWPARGCKPRRRWAFLLACTLLGWTGPPAAAGEPKSPAAMLAEELRARGIEDPRVLAAMAAVPRHEFVPATLVGEAYADRALPIGEGQTISQPYVVALMTELLRLHGGEKVLEVGTGSGYQAAVLAELGCAVYSIEIIPRLAAEAKSRLERLGYDKVQVREGDGRAGWPSAAPFDAIIVTAAAVEVPPALLEQLREGGNLVIPLGESRGYQELVQIHKTAEGVRRREVTGVRFVPLVGKTGRDHGSGGSDSDGGKR